MKNLRLLLLFCCPLFLQAQQRVSKQTLIHVNQYWKNKIFPSSPMMEVSGEIELLQTHLRFVEANLRAQSKQVPQATRQKRNHCLDILHQYWTAGKFPKNLYHTQRTPYFIDDYGTYCAVGYLLQQTGFDDVAQKIHQDNNYGYVMDLKQHYPEITTWAKAYGFTPQELAWIQPTYQPQYVYAADTSTITYDTVFTVHAATCDGKNDGGVSLAYHPVPYIQVLVTEHLFGMPPYWYVAPTTNLTSGMSSGYYGIQAIDSNNDTTFIQNFYIPTQTQLWATAHVSNELCHQPCTGSISIDSIQNAVPPIQYSLNGNLGNYQSSPLFTNLCAGSYYEIAFKDSIGCYGALTTLAVDINGPLQVTQQVTSPILCAGSSAWVTIGASQGTPPYVGSGPIYLGPGQYTQVVTDAMGCTDSVSFILTSPPALTISSTSIADHGSGDGQAGVTVSGGIPPYTYSWSNGINNTATISNLNSGLYTCVVMDSNNCQIVEDIMVALEYPQLLTTLNPASISVLPNPCQHQLWIQHTSAKSWKQLYTQFGQLVISTQQNPLDVSQLAKGVYYLRCEGQQLKVIKE